MSENIVIIPASKYFGVCLILSLLIGVLNPIAPVGPNFLAFEVLITVLALFFFGSSRYVIDKNAIAYGAIIVIGVTFFYVWWPTSALRLTISQGDRTVLVREIQRNLFSLDGLDRLIHADTMLFILGLTFFVSVISQTRLPESISIRLLYFFKGRIFLTIFFLTVLVSFFSGILDGVSMIGFFIRVLVFILVMAKASRSKIEFIVMTSVVTTTVCGMWLAYGEPPNLIMKSNLNLSDTFFLIYCLPMAMVSLMVVAWFIYRPIQNSVIQVNQLDILRRRIADIRFLQVKRYGEIREVGALLQEDLEHQAASHAKPMPLRVGEGSEVIASSVVSGVAPAKVQAAIRDYLGQEFVEPVYAYYEKWRGGQEDPTAMARIEGLLSPIRKERLMAQGWGVLSFIPFIGLLILHAQDHTIPLFVPSFVAFLCAFIGISAFPRIRRLALHEAVHEYKEYLFLFPLFLSITLLTVAGFFDPAKGVIQEGVDHFGRTEVALLQFIGSGVLSALLDNNVVADFASRAIDGMPDRFLFAAAQVAGYATGGSLTHIGSAQSVVAYAFILRAVNPSFTPWAWIRAIWKLVAALTVALGGMICLMAALTA